MNTEIVTPRPVTPEHDRILRDSELPWYVGAVSLAGAGSGLPSLEALAASRQERDKPVEFPEGISPVVCLNQELLEMMTEEEREKVLKEYTKASQDANAGVKQATQSGQEISQETFQNMEAIGAGWKIHLNFDARDTEQADIVRSVLEDLGKQGAFAIFKIGDGGGEAYDQPGKEATVYIGSKDRMKFVAELLEQRLGGVLLPVSGEALKDDTKVSDVIAARFDVHRVDDEFTQYGSDGLPNRKADVLNNLYTDPSEKVSQDRQVEIIRNNAQTTLTRRYGSYFTGTQTN